MSPARWKAKLVVESRMQCRTRSLWNISVEDVIVTLSHVVHLHLLFVSRFVIVFQAISEHVSVCKPEHYDMLSSNSQIFHCSGRWLRPSARLETIGSRQLKEGCGISRHDSSHDSHTQTLGLFSDTGEESRSMIVGQNESNRQRQFAVTEEYGRYVSRFWVKG